MYRGLRRKETEDGKSFNRKERKGHKKERSAVMGTGSFLKTKKQPVPGSSLRRD
jgi:hypothetical protein